MFNSESEKKKSFNELSEDFIIFWKPYFEHYSINPNFKTKLCYNAKEFPLIEGQKQQAVRFFESELNDKQDMYIELCDWDNNFYDPMFRKLYLLKHNPNWKSESDKYIPSGNPKFPTYAVKMSDLELLNETSITSSIPIIGKEEEKFEEFKEEEFFEDFTEDEHYTKITIRDIYSIIHNKPVSNKEWLNKLISKNQ